MTGSMWVPHFAVVTADRAREVVGADGPFSPDEDDLDVFLSFDECPNDVYEPDYPDGDDSLLASASMPGGPGGLPDAPVKFAALPASVAKLTPTPKRKKVVPHPRDLKLNDKGLDVRALKRALWRAGYLRRTSGGFDTVFNRHLKDTVARFQRHNGLDADGVYGVKTHVKLARWYDGFAIKLLNRTHVITKEQMAQADIVAGAMALYNVASKVHYSMGPSRMYCVRNHLLIPDIPRQAGITEDCSSSSTWTALQAGLKNPNGFPGWSPWGFTGTFIHGGVESTYAGGGAGCYDFFGWSRWATHHMTIVVSSAKCVSHGSEIGPLLLDRRYRSDYVATRRLV